MRKAPKRALPLREAPFFRQLSAGTVSRVEGLVYHRDYEPRQIVFFPDDPCDFVYWVREGRLRITRVSGDGRELTFRHLFAGDMVGEDCLLDRPKRENYAEAMVSSTLCLMRAGDFRRLLRDDAELAQAVLLHACRNVAEMEQVFVETVFLSVRSRVAAGLVRVFKHQTPRTQGIVQITHQELANLVGTTRETTTAVLHALREEKLISLANRRINILDLAGLQDLAKRT